MRIAPNYALFLLLTACADKSADADADTTGDTTDASATTGAAPTTGADTDPTPGDPTVLVGSFQIQLDPPSGDTPGKTAILGKIYDGPTPAQIVWEEAAVDGDCRLMTPRVPFCSVSCGGTAVCVEDETCQDYPTAHGAGTVTVTGLAQASGDASFTMQPIANNYQPGAGVVLEYPSFGDGDAITLEAAGEYFQAFTLAATGVAPIALDNDTITLSADAAIDLKWPAGANADARMRVKLDISHHGGTRGMITCEAADAGMLAISAGLVGQLLDLGVAGYPTIIVTREVVGATTIAPGRVELVVSSSLERAVVVPGVQSCTDDAQCPDGQNCQPDLTCQ